MDFILLPRQENFTSDGAEFCLREVCINDLFTLHRALEAVERAGTITKQTRRELCKIILPMVESKENVSDVALLRACSRLLLFSIADKVVMESKGSKGNRGTKDPADLYDADLVKILDTIGARYGKTPIELTKELTYRQALYLFVISFNGTLQEAARNGCKVNEEQYLNAQGMLCNVKSLSDKDRMAYYARLSKKSRGGM